MKDWVFWMGFWFAIVVIAFVFLGIPLIAYLGFTRKLKFLPSMEDLLKQFPNAMIDLGKRPPYNRLNPANAMAVLYFELIISLYLIRFVKMFKRGG
jgi:hypothetical protein